MSTTSKRIFRAGWKNFSRNSGLTVATIFIMVMVVSLATLLFLLNPISRALVSILQEKVDVSVYFKKDALPEEILELKSQLTEIPEVKEVEYVSREEALEKFIERHRDDPTLMESLAEVGENPFLASLSVRTQEPSQYEQVTNFLEEGLFRDLIEKVDYHQRKPVMDKVFAIASTINRTGIFLNLILGLIAVLVAYNAAKLAIYSSSEEISVMRLVGASNWFIRGPFLIQGALIGIIAALITLLLTFAVCAVFGQNIKTLISEVDLLGLFFGNFWILVLIQILTGVGLGMISSLIAIRKYLKV